MYVQLQTALVNLSLSMAHKNQMRSKPIYISTNAIPQARPKNWLTHTLHASRAAGHGCPHLLRCRGTANVFFFLRLPKKSLGSFATTLLTSPDSPHRHLPFARGRFEKIGGRRSRPAPPRHHPPLPLLPSKKKHIVRVKARDRLPIIPVWSYLKF